MAWVGVGKEGQETREESGEKTGNEVKGENTREQNGKKWKGTRESTKKRNEETK